ncbi:MAG TPA: MEDS domain-containing protein [Candidatus Methylomirabilis sp.]|nr:MEDS domain-containing protein [Candidatus Methylomirabilis sp.]
MRTGESERSITFAGTRLGRHRHVCAFFNTRDEEYRVFLPFIKEGLANGEKAFHIMDPNLRRDHVERLAAAGVNVTAVEKTGQLELRTWQDAYLRGGHFDQAAMLALIEEVLADGKRRGFPLTRLVAHMEWALEDRPGVDDLVEYETRLNYILPKYPDPVL